MGASLPKARLRFKPSFRPSPCSFAVILIAAAEYSTPPATPAGQAQAAADERHVGQPPDGRQLAERVNEDHRSRGGLLRAMRSRTRARGIGLAAAQDCFALLLEPACHFLEALFVPRHDDQA